MTYGPEQGIVGARHGPSHIVVTVVTHAGVGQQGVDTQGVGRAGGGVRGGAEVTTCKRIQSIHYDKLMLCERQELTLPSPTSQSSSPVSKSSSPTSQSRSPTPSPAVLPPSPAVLPPSPTSQSRSPTPSPGVQLPVQQSYLQVLPPSPAVLPSQWQSYLPSTAGPGQWSGRGPSVIG